MGWYGDGSGARRRLSAMDSGAVVDKSYSGGCSTLLFPFFFFLLKMRCVHFFSFCPRGKMPRGALSAVYGENTHGEVKSVYIDMR